jgi:methyl-accepting chemotaxis protein
LPNDPLDWVEDSSADEKPMAESVDHVNEAPESPAQIYNEGNESMSEAVKSGQGEGARQNLMHEVLRLVEASRKGQLDERANVAAFDGDDAKVLRGVNDMLDQILVPIAEGNRILDQIAKGKIDELVAKTYQGDHEKMKQNVNGVALVLQKFQEEFAQMAEHSRQGKLDKRAKANSFEGVYQEIIKGFNETLDVILLPIGEGNRVLDRIAKGNIDELVVQTYQGDHEKMKQNVNAIALMLRKFQAEFAQLAEYSRLGQLEKRGAASAFEGAYGEIIRGANEMLDAILLPIGEGNRILDQIAKGKIDELVAKTYQGDHEKMKQNVNGIALMLRRFQAEFAQLAEYSRLGQLDKRGNASAFEGAYGEIVKGANDMLDAILLPIGEGNRILAQIAVGNFKETVDLACQGDHQKMKDSINAVHSAVSTLIGDAGNLAQSIVDGNIHIQTNASAYRGDYRKIIDAFEDAFAGLNKTFYQIVDSVEQVGQSAEQLNAASQNMASTSEEQASSVEEVTSSLEETDSQVKANTDGANTANQLVLGTSQAANAGQAKMEEMNKAMNEINASARGIAKIIKVIDEIAFQTNLLALNAAVEAARAGQHGRGFAVVAQEVRNLAGRSAKAARETADLIENSVKLVSDGVAIAKETSEALNQIVTNVVKVKDLVGEIATASAEQSRGVGQINVAMNQVAKAAQEGSQQSEELASASSELANLADRMRSEVRRFKLRERKQSGSEIAGLEGLTADMLVQLKAMLAGRNVAPAQAAAKPSNSARKSPQSVLPLDHDKRGYGNF